MISVDNWTKMNAPTLLFDASPKRHFSSARYATPLCIGCFQAVITAEAVYSRPKT